MKMNFELPDQNDDTKTLHISYEKESENVMFSIICEDIDNLNDANIVTPVEISLDDLVRIVKQLQHDIYYVDYVNNKKKNSSA